MALVYYQFEKYYDIVSFLKGIVQERSGDVSINFRNFLSVGFQEIIYFQRSDWITSQSKKHIHFRLREILKAEK